MKIHGLLIDPQEDFCNPELGTLYVPGAEKDILRIADLLRRIGALVEALHVTLDSHHTLDIAHPIWWQDESKMHPAPFTIISGDEIDSGRWTTTRPQSLARSRAYVAHLEANGRYPLCIWPYHCLIGTPGNAVASPLAASLAEWEAATMRPVNYVRKGSNIWTEHYSAIRADVPDPDDPGTQPNQTLLDALESADVVFVAGEAGSHCVANTVRDIAASRGDAMLRKIVLLTDAVSPVGGFESLQTDFLSEMTAHGMRTSPIDDFLR